MIEFKCEFCRAEMEAPQSLAGQSENCPKCGLSNLVPARSGADALGASGLNRAASKARPVASAKGGKHLMIFGAIAGLIAAAGGGGYLLGVRQGKADAATRETIARSTTDSHLPLPQGRPEAATREMPRQAEVQAIPAAPALIPAPPPVPKGIAVSGSAYVVRNSGQSDILRGFHVTLIQDRVPPSVLRTALTKVVQNYTSEAADQRKKAAEARKSWPGMKLTGDGYDPGKFYEDDAKKAENNAQTYSGLLTKISESSDSAEALVLLEKTSYVNVIRDLTGSIQIATTTTDVQGTYKFANAPTNAYIFAMFDTSNGFLMWAVPVQGSGSKDLFNDTALPSR